jgi:hypothetical protein
MDESLQIYHFWKNKLCNETTEHVIQKSRLKLNKQNG